MSKELAKEWLKKACNEYLRLFCEKHDYCYTEDVWVGGYVCGIANIGDYFIDFETICIDVEEDVDKDEFIKWYDYCVEAEDLGINTPNYRSWIKGCPRTSNEQLQKLKKLKNEFVELIKKENNNESF
jgi:hypothetical protein